MQSPVKENIFWDMLSPTFEKKKCVIYIVVIHA